MTWDRWEVTLDTWHMIFFMFFFNYSCRSINFDFFVIAATIRQHQKIKLSPLCGIFCTQLKTKARTQRKTAASWKISQSDKPWKREGGFSKVIETKLLLETEMDLFSSKLWRSSFFLVYNYKTPQTGRIFQLKVRLKFHILKGNLVLMFHSRDSISVQCRIDQYRVLAWYLLSLFIWRESLVILCFPFIYFT